MSAFTVGCVAWITDYWPIPFLFAVAVLIFADLIEWRHARSVPRQWFAVIVACITLVGAALVAVGPVNWGLAIGSYAVLQVALNFWLGAAFLLYLVARTLAGSRKVRSVRGVLPASITMLLLWLFFTGPFDLREVRLLDSQRIASPATGLRQQATAWLEARRKEISESSACYPVFVVNADGGGVRAAWWSATILSTLQDREGKFSEHVFAISGVSGGSLGAAVFAARAAHSPSPGKPCAQTWRSCTDAVLARDLLGPAVGSMIISDAFGAITRLDLLQDRATALEKAFESAWLDASGHDTFGEPFEMLWGGDGATRVPSLMLNATDAPNARRLVLSPVPLFRGDTDKADLGVLLGTRALRLSTAVLLSARFPGISPAGWLPAPEGPAGHGTAIVDGGFVDNSGARSASEAVAALHAAAETLGLPKVLPVALMIGNTPVSSNSPPDVSAPGTRSAFAATTFGSLISPVLTLEGLRQLSAVQAKREYRATVAAAGGLVLDGFDLRADGGTYPLGWMLAEGTRKDMGRQIDEMTQDSSSHFAVAAGLLRRCRRDR
ncbi:patatin-like phospholipase family protein [Bradyrhizobium sp. Arg816]|uniref:patatin-like phospholipase family protein n=1 Tax=Bradyrhizobium sp. Arg816 TaxID=2998491 RepID=UPI00249E8A56|nr:patatin-like phospholipase family protein [Bradyrhizobium sp. Arg816]